MDEKYAIIGFFYYCSRFFYVSDTFQLFEFLQLQIVTAIVLPDKVMKGTYFVELK